MKTQGISLIVCLSIVLISSSATWADPVASALLRRGDMVEYQIGENPPVIREVVSITETSINYSGAYGALIKTDPSDVSHIWGSIPSITSG